MLNGRSETEEEVSHKLFKLSCGIRFSLTFTHMTRTWTSSSSFDFLLLLFNLFNFIFFWFIEFFFIFLFHFHLSSEADSIQLCKESLNQQIHDLTQNKIKELSCVAFKFSNTGVYLNCLHSLPSSSHHSFIGMHDAGPIIISCVMVLWPFTTSTQCILMRIYPTSRQHQKFSQRETKTRQKYSTYQQRPRRGGVTASDDTGINVSVYERRKL